MNHKDLLPYHCNVCNQTLNNDEMLHKIFPIFHFDNFPYVTCASYLLLPYPALSLDITALLCSLSDRDLKGLNLQHT